MWLFSKHGFVSAVRNRNDNSLIHIRSFFKGDLERILARSGINREVVETPDADYYYRTDVTNDEWEKILVKESESIDYDNFKNAVDAQGYKDDRFTTYMEVHGVLGNAGWSARQ